MTRPPMITVFLMIFTLNITVAQDSLLPDPNAIEKEAAEVEAMVKQLPAKEQALQEKEYSGTIDQIYAQRVVDVNEVAVFARKLQIKAVDVAGKMGLDTRKKGVIQAILDRKAKAKEQQRANNEIISHVSAAFNDPNIVPPVDDPNHIDQLTAMNELLTFCLVELSPK